MRQTICKLKFLLKFADKYLYIDSVKKTHNWLFWTKWREIENKNRLKSLNLDFLLSVRHLYNKWLLEM